MAKGFLYVLCNDSFPGLLKIGFSVKVPSERAGELYSTGVPDPFTIAYYCLVENAKALELEIHNRLADKRHRDGREFFRTESDAVIKLIKGLCSPEHEYYQEGILPVQNSLEFDGNMAYGINIQSRYDLDYEIREMVGFCKLVHERGLTLYVRSIFYDSKGCIASFKLAQKIKEFDPVAEEIKGIALETIGQFDWFDRVLHGRHKPN